MSKGGVTLRIGIDLDGTVADNFDLLVDTFNAYCGKSLQGKDIKQYSLCKAYSISEQEFNELMDQKEERIITTSPLIPLAREKISQLVKEGWEVHIITARHPKYKVITENWLQKKGIPYTGLHLLNSHDKLDLCRELEVRCMVEDNIHNAYQLDDGGVNVILFEAPHNECWPWQGIRCHSWAEIYQTIASRYK